MLFGCSHLALLLGLSGFLAYGFVVFSFEEEEEECLL